MLALALFRSAFWSTSPVQAQTTSAVCGRNFSYLSNTEGQTPCLIAAYLQAPCSREGPSFNLPPLQNDSYYTGPEVDEGNYCTCSSVVYSLSSACAACQDERWISWSYWRRNCDQNLITLGEYPLDIPEGTAVPAWAYQNVGLTDRWNISLTSTSTTLGPESTYYGTPTASRSYTPSMPSDAESTATQTNSSAGTGSATAGAITGGIIGGIGLLALIGALAWILIRRRRRKGDMDHPIGLFGPGGPPVGGADQHNLPAAVDYGAAYPHTPSPFTGSTSTMPKLYDPTDPTTFPPRTPVSFGYQSALPTGTDATPSNPLPSNPTHDHTVHSAGRYSGAPEL